MLEAIPRGHPGGRQRREDKDDEDRDAHGALARREEDPRFGLSLRQHERLFEFAGAEHGRDARDEREHLEVGERLR